MVLFFLFPHTAKAQSQRNPCFYATSTSTGCTSVSGTNPLPVTASATISGGFTDAATGTPISVTTGGVTGTLPAGTVVAAFNVGTTNAAYCKLGASATTSDIYLAPGGGWFAFQVGANTQLTCITSTSTTTVNMVGGSGLPTGSGGGSGGGGGGGAVTIADGANVVEGALADAAATAGGTGTFSAKFRLMTTQLNTINTTLGTPFQAGGSIGNTSFAVTQATSSNLKAQVDPLTAASWGIGTSTQNSASVANGHLVLGQFNTTPTTITSGNMSPFQLDNAGNLLVNVKAGGGSGGTSSNFGSAFPAAGTAIGFTNGTNLTAASVGAVANVAAATNFVNSLNICQYNATPLTVTDTRYQSTQCDVNGFLKVNVTNTNPNGSAVSASSSPVVIASDQVAVATKAAASAYASGAIVDIINMSAATGAAAPSKVIYGGMLASGATGGQLRGQINCDNHVFKHITTATDTLAVQGVASQTIYICGWRSRAAGTATWYLENTASTNANCASTLTQITGVASEVANSGEVAYNPIWGGLKNTSGNGLCINSTGTGGVDIDIWYTQF